MGILGWHLSQCFSRYDGHQAEPFTRQLLTATTSSASHRNEHHSRCAWQPTVLERAYVPQDVIKAPHLIPRCAKRVPIVTVASEHSNAGGSYSGLHHLWSLQQQLCNELRHCSRPAHAGLLDSEHLWPFLPTCVEAGQAQPLLQK